jgi:hypothetical protein
MQEELNEGQNQRFVGTDVSKVFLGNNTTQKEEYVNNSGYDPISLPPGTVMGRIAGTDIVVPCTSAATDGSEQPIGVLMQDLEIDSGDTVNAVLCNGGDIAAEKISFYHPTDSLNSQVDGVRMKDLLLRNTTIKLIWSDEMSGDYDNY